MLVDFKKVRQPLDFFNTIRKVLTTAEMLQLLKVSHNTYYKFLHRLEWDTSMTTAKGSNKMYRRICSVLTDFMFGDHHEEE